MAKYEPDAKDIILARANMKGLRRYEDISKYTGISTVTIGRRFVTDKWTLPELRLLNKKLEFTVADAEALLGKLRNDD